jgi:hypothetical protein
MNLRIKTGQEPGDLGKSEKQKMLEGKHKDKKRAKNFKKYVRMQERAVLKERAKKRIEQDLSEES